MLYNAIEHDADISCCLLEVVEINGSVRPSLKGRSGIFSNKDIISAYFSDQFVKDLMYGPYNKLYKRNLLKDIRFKPYRLGEDILFVFEILLSCHTIYIGDNAASMLSSLNSMQMGFNFIIGMIISFVYSLVMTLIGYKLNIFN